MDFSMLASHWRRVGQVQRFVLQGGGDKLTDGQTSERNSRKYIWICKHSHFFTLTCTACLL